MFWQFAIKKFNSRPSAFTIYDTNSFNSLVEHKNLNKLVLLLLNSLSVISERYLILTFKSQKASFLKETFPQSFDKI